ncbi:MAG: lactate racemase domain-containing protein [Candidatus Hodarchaeales archaeon]
MKSESYLKTPLWYEKEKISYFIPKGSNCRYLQVPKAKLIRDLEETLKNAVNSPVESLSLEDMISKHYQQGETVVILLDDTTRPNIHTRTLLPLLAKRLDEYGVVGPDIRLMIATGTHTPPNSKLIKEKILGDQYDSWKNRIWVHDCDDIENHENIGFSAQNTPILIDKRVLSCSLIIPLSDSEYHYFAGVAGSVKLFVPGVSARKTVRVNHSRIFDLKTGFKTECRMGNIENNVSIQDIREIVKILMEKHNQKIFVIDAIMQQGSFVDIIAGNPIAIHDNALNALSRVRDVLIPEKADLVIVAKPSVNFYQAGKGLNAASHAVKQGGQIVLLAGCREGFGPDDYLKTMNRVKNMSYLEAMQWVIKNKCSESTFEIGIQNAVDLFRILQLTEGHLFIYSELDPQILKETFRNHSLNTKKASQEALRSFVKEFLDRHPNGLIHVFEDYNILVIPNKNKLKD